MDKEGRWKVLDLAASLAIAIALLATTAWTGIELTTMPRHMEMFAEMGAVELPIFTRIMWALVGYKVLHAIALILLLGGMACLFAVGDRLRANVYALVAIVLLVSMSALIRLSSLAPLTRVISEVSYQAPGTPKS